MAAYSMAANMDRLQYLKKDITGSNKKKRFQALETLMDLSSYENRRNRVRLQESGIISALKNTIARKKKNTDITLLALKVLVNLSVERENWDPLVHDYNLVPVLSNVLKLALPKVDEHCIQTAKCLVNLSIDPRNREIIGQPSVVNMLAKLVHIDRGEGRQWAVWALTNIAICPANTDTMVRYGVVDELVQTIRGSTSDDPKTRGVMALRNLAKHAKAAPAIVKAGVLDHLLRFVRQGTFDKPGNSLEECALYTLLRLAQHEVSRKKLRDCGGIQDLSPLAEKTSFVGLVGLMTLCSILTPDEGAFELIHLQSASMFRLSQLLRCTLNGEGIDMVCEYGLFSLDLIVDCIRKLATAPGNRKQMVSGELMNDLTRVMREGEISLNTALGALQTMCLLANEPRGNKLLTSDPHLKEVLTNIARDPDKTQEMKMLARELTRELERSMPKHLIFDCNDTMTRAIVYQEGASRKAPIEVEVLPDVLGSLRSMSSPRDAEEYFREIIAEVTPETVVIGLTGWYRVASAEIKDSVTTMFDIVQATCEGVRLRVVPLSVTEEGMCEAKAVSYAVQMNGMRQPDLIIATLGDCFQFVSEDRFFAIPTPRFTHCQNLIRDNGVDGVAEAEDLWERAIDTFQEKHPQLSLTKGSVLALRECSVGAKAAGLPIGTPTDSGTVVDAFTQKMDAMLEEYSPVDDITDAPQIPRKDAQTLSHVTAMAAVFDTFVDPSSEVIFMSEWEVDNKPFETSWCTGWYLTVRECQPNRNRFSRGTELPKGDREA